MTMTGVVLMVIGIITGATILWSIGVILVVIGVILWVLGANGRSVGRRRHYF